MNAKQIDEARNLVKEANGLSKRSLFRWSPEYDTAATKFEKAATLYKNGKQFNDSVSCYCSAGDCYNKSNSSYLAAKNYECAGNVRRDEKRYEESTKLYEQAARFYLEDGKPERASEVLLKAAKALENNLKDNKSIFVDEPTIQQAIRVYQKVIEIFHNEQKYHMMADPLRSYNSFLLKQGYIKEAIDNFKLSVEVFTALKQTHNIFKAYVSIVILHLANDDYAAADEANREFSATTPAYDRSDEGDIATDFLSAFENFSAESLESAKKHVQLKFLEPQVHSIAKNLKLSGDSTVRKPRQTSQASSKSTQLTQGKQKLLFDDVAEHGSDDDGCDENGVPIRKEVDLTGADDDLTGAEPSNNNNQNQYQEADIFDDEDLT